MSTSVGQDTSTSNTGIVGTGDDAVRGKSSQQKCQIAVSKKSMTSSKPKKRKGNKDAIFAPKDVEDPFVGKHVAFECNGFIGEQLEEKFGKIAEEHMMCYNNMPYVTGSITGITSGKVAKMLLYEVEFSWTGFGSTPVDYKCIPSAVVVGKKCIHSM